MQPKLGSKTVIRKRNAAESLALVTQVCNNYVHRLFPELEAGDFVPAIRNGQILCRICNAIKPGAIPNISTMNKPYMSLANLAQARTFFLSIGFQEGQLFDPADLMKEPPPDYCVRAVCYILLSLEHFSCVGSMDVQDKAQIMATETATELLTVHLTLPDDMKAKPQATNIQQQEIVFETEEKPLGESSDDFPAAPPAPKPAQAEIQQTHSEKYTDEKSSLLGETVEAPAQIQQPKSLMQQLKLCCKPWMWIVLIAVVVVAGVVVAVVASQK